MNEKWQWNDLFWFYCGIIGRLMWHGFCYRIGKNGNKWQFWVKLQQLRRWDSIDREVKQLIDDLHEQNKKKVFDKSVANAMSNANVEMSIKKNKS